MATQTEKHDWIERLAELYYDQIKVSEKVTYEDAPTSVKDLCRITARKFLNLFMTFCIEKRDKWVASSEKLREKVHAIQ